MFLGVPDLAVPVAPTNLARVTWTSSRNSSKRLTREGTKKMAPPSRALMDVKESTVIGAQLLFQNAKAFVRSVVPCVSGQVDLVKPAGISVRLVGSRDIDVLPPARDWKLVMRRRKATALTRRVWLNELCYFVTSYMTRVVKFLTKEVSIGSSAAEAIILLCSELAITCVFLLLTRLCLGTAILLRINFPATH